MSDATTVDMSLQQSCNAAMLHANVEVRLLIDKANRLESENTKLRELVRYMWFADYAGHFSTLPEHQEHHATVWQRMRELGIEVHQ